jgi:two-component system CheB/CheR fusion protein
MAIALQNSSDAITIQDFNGNIKVWNKGAQKMYGWTEAQALAMNINKIVPPYKYTHMYDLQAN